MMVSRSREDAPTSHPTAVTASPRAMGTDLQLFTALCGIPSPVRRGKRAAGPALEGEERWRPWQARLRDWSAHWYSTCGFYCFSNWASA